MSNAVIVIQALFGGGHSTALLLTTGGLLSRSDLFGHVVINLFDLFLLSCLEDLFFHMERPINAEDTSSFCAFGCVACENHPAWPTTTCPFEHSGLGSEDVDP